MPQAHKIVVKQVSGFMGCLFLKNIQVVKTGVRQAVNDRHKKKPFTEVKGFLV
jgi:hypothetical protein